MNTAPGGQSDLDKPFAVRHRRDRMDSTTEAALRTAVDRYTETLNSREAGRLTALFADDADLIMGNQPKIVGRDAIQRWWSAYFERADVGVLGRFVVDDLRLVGSDAAVINVTAMAETVSESTATPLARGTWMMSRRDDVWFVAAMRAQPLAGSTREPGARMGGDVP